MLYLDCSNISFSLWTPAVCDSSCLTGYEPHTLVAPNFLSLLSLKKIFLLHSSPSIHLQILLLLTPCPQNTKPTHIIFRPSLEPTTSTWSEEMKALFHSKGLWQLMNGKKPCPTTAGLDQTTGTSSRIGQLASWCSTFHLTRESTSEQTRMTPQRLGVHWKRSLSSRRWTATLWHMTSSSAFEMH